VSWLESLAKRKRAPKCARGTRRRAAPPSPSPPREVCEVLWTKQQGPASAFARHALPRPREFDLVLRRCRLAQSPQTTPRASRRDRAAPLRLDASVARIRALATRLPFERAAWFPICLRLSPCAFDGCCCRIRADTSVANDVARRRLPLGLAGRRRRLALDVWRLGRQDDLAHAGPSLVLIARLTSPGDRRATAHVRAVAPGRAFPARWARPRPVHHHRARHVRLRADAGLL